MKKRNFPVRPVLIACALIAVAVLVYVLSISNLRNYALDKASDATGRQVSAGEKIKIDWGWPVLGVHLTDVSLSNFDEGSKENMFAADKIYVSINLFTLLKGNVELPEIYLENPDLLLEKDKDGNANWNLTDNGTSAMAADAVTPDDRGDFPMIGRLVIKKGKVAFKDDVKKTNIELDVDTVSGSAEEDEMLKFLGNGRLNDQVFKLDITGGNVMRLKESSKPYPIDFEVHAGETSLKLIGTMLDPVQFKGMDTKLTLKGPDAAELFNLIGVALPPTPPYDVTGQLFFEDNVWKFSDFKGRMGGSDLSGNVTWDTSKDRPKLSGEFISQKLNFKDLGGFVGAKAAIEGESVSDRQKREAAEAEADPYIIPNTPLDISRLSSMDADVSFTGKKLISENLPLDDFFMKVNLDNSLLKLEPVRFGTAKGDIEAFMTINARQKPTEIGGEFNFRRLSLKPIFAGLSKTLGKPNYAEGYIGGTAKLKGKGESLREMLATSNGNVGLGMEGGSLSNLVVEILGLDVAEGLGFFIGGDQPVPVRCVIADFGVNNGMMGVRHFVIDTKDSNVQGKGNINLKNEELNLTLQTYAKDNTLVSLNSPIRFTGTLKKPSVNLNVAKIAARGAVAAVASVVAAPLAALAFIEKGLGEDSACNALVKEMNKNNKNTPKESLIPKNKTKVIQPAK